MFTRTPRLMRYTFADTLRQLEPLLPAPLLPQGTRGSLTAVAAAVPAELSSWFYLECRLRADAPQVDMVLDIPPTGRELIGAGRYPAADATAPPSDGWCQIRDLCTAWSTPDSLLRRAAGTLWLEYDVDPTAEHSKQAVPAPGVFVSLVELHPADTAPADWAALAEAVLRPLWGQAIPRRLLEQLCRVFVNLPGAAYIPYLGVMLSRAERAVRVCAVKIDQADLPEYLHRIGWPGQRGELNRVLGSLAGDGVYPGPQVLHIDVAEDVRPRLGLEYMFARRPQLAGIYREAAFLDHLVRLELAAPEKRDALLGWPGYSFLQLRHEVWTSLLVRRLNHVKAVYEPGRGVEAKAYLNVFHKFHRASGHGGSRSPYSHTRDHG